MASSGIKGNKVLFICLGNICRSPTAEAVFNYVLKERLLQGWEVDSAGVGDWHIGRSPDHRALSVMKKHDIPVKHKARQLRKQDFKYYDYIFGMDEENMNDLKSMSPDDGSAKLLLFGKFDPENEIIIRDPYYDDDDDTEGFEKCYEQCVRCSDGFITSLSL